MTESYDAAMITLKALAKSDGTPEDAKRQMFAIGNNYSCASGTITFDEHGDIEVSLNMKTVQNGTFKELIR